MCVHVIEGFFHPPNHLRHQPIEGFDLHLNRRDEVTGDAVFGKRQEFCGGDNNCADY